jgi:hypothetical protein
MMSLMLLLPCISPDHVCVPAAADAAAATVAAVAADDAAVAVSGSAGAADRQCARWAP